MWAPSFFVGYGVDDKKRHMCVEGYAVFGIKEEKNEQQD